MWTCPDGARLLRRVAPRCRAPNIMFHKNKLVSIIRSSGTIFYSLLYLNSRIGPNGLKFLYSVISVIDKRLPGKTKKWTLVHSWTARVRLVHSWADSSELSSHRDTLALVCALSLILTNSPSHTHETHERVHPCNSSLSLPLALSLFFSISVSFSRSPFHSLSSCALSRFLSLALSLSRSFFLSDFHSPALACTRALSLLLLLSRADTLALQKYTPEIHMCVNTFSQ